MTPSPERRYDLPVMRRDEISTLFKRYGPVVYRRALSILRDPSLAEEATQDIFIKAIKSADTFDGRSKVTTWLYQITTNHCLNQLRDRTRRRELWSEHGETTRPSDLASPDDGLVLRTLLQDADPQQAQAAVYVYIDGMSHQEAAELLDISRRSVGNLLERFNTWARTRLEDKE